MITFGSDPPPTPYKSSVFWQLDHFCEKMIFRTIGTKKINKVNSNNWPRLTAPPFPYKLSPKILFDIPIWVLVNIEWTTIFLDTKMLEIENNVQTCLSTRHFAWIDVNCCRVCLKKSSTNNFQNKLRRHWPLEEVEYLPKVTLHQLAGLNLWLSEAYVMS